MRNAKLTLAAAALAAGVIGAWGVPTLEAQEQAAFRRTPVQKHDLSGLGREAVQALGEFAPGASAGKHTHPGEELGYVLEGTLVLEVEGQPPRTLKAGDSFFVPAGVAHDAKNIGGAPVKVLATYIIEKGKPLATPVK